MLNNAKRIGKKTYLNEKITIKLKISLSNVQPNHLDENLFNFYFLLLLIYAI